MKVQSSDIKRSFERDQSETSPVLAPLPHSHPHSHHHPHHSHVTPPTIHGPSDDSAPQSEDVFQLWHGKDALVPTFDQQRLPVPIINDTERRRAKAREIANLDIDVRAMSARQMANVSTDLYMQGLITWDEYDALAFQSELHPDYNKTIGALVDKKAEPDEPRDFVREWEKRLSFVNRYNNKDITTIKTAQRITRLLQQMAGVLAYG